MSSRHRPVWMIVVSFVLLLALPSPVHAGANHAVVTPAASLNNGLGCIVVQASHSHQSANYPAETAGVVNGLGVTSYGYQPNQCFGSTFWYVDNEVAYYFTTDPAAGPQHQCAFIPYNGYVWGSKFTPNVYSGIAGPGYTCENPDRDGWYATSSNSQISTLGGAFAYVGYGSWWIYQHSPYI